MQETCMNMWIVLSNRIINCASEFRSFFCLTNHVTRCQTVVSPFFANTFRLPKGDLGSLHLTKSQLHIDVMVHSLTTRCPFWDPGMQKTNNFNQENVQGLQYTWDMAVILPGREPCYNYIFSDLPLPRQCCHKQIYISAHIRDIVDILFMHTYRAEQCYSWSIGTYCTDSIVP